MTDRLADGTVKYTSICRFRHAVSTTRLSYDCDTVGGSSGSPVYDNGWYVRGINAYEYPNTTIPNYGPRITNSLFQDLVSAKVQYNLPGPGYLDEATSSIIRGSIRKYRYINDKVIRYLSTIILGGIYENNNKKIHFYRYIISY